MAQTCVANGGNTFMKNLFSLGELAADRLEKWRSVGEVKDQQWVEVPVKKVVSM